MTLVIPAPAVCGSDFGGCKPLILDPWVSNRRLLRETLRDLGCLSIQDTGSATEAWTLLRRGGVTAIFLDWSPDTDAVAFLRRLRNRDNPDRFVPLVVMTAYAGAEHVITMRDMGATEFMLRPFSNEVVASRLRSIVRTPRLFVDGGEFFGPDRRRRRIDWRAPERRNHENWRSADRRRVAGDPWSGPERRQGRPGFEPLERRSASRI